MAALLFLAACGGSKKTTATSGPGIPSVVTLSPSVASVAHVPPGQGGGTVSFSASVVDVNNNAVTNQTISFHSSNTAVLTIANSGLACAGTWDSLTTPVVCTPGPSGIVEVTAISGTLTSSSATVYVHDKVDTVTVSPTNVACVSNGNLLQFTAHAFAAGKDITSQVGPFVWNSTNSNVVGIDQTGLATAATPGVAAVFAGVNGVNSISVPYTTCPIVSLSLLTSAGGNSFSVDNSSTQNLSVTAVDSSGAVVNNSTSSFLTFSLSNGAVGSVTGGLFSASQAGTTTIVASCTPPSCNVGLTPVYSNAMVGNVNGTATTTVYVASPSSTSLIPIDTSTNTAGTAITLPANPNSLVINSTGSKAYLGSDNVLMLVDLSANTVATIANVGGRVIGVSPDGNKAFIINNTTNTLYAVDVTGAGTESFLAPGVTRVSESLDNYKAYIVGSNTLYTFSPNLAFKTELLPAVANDVAFHASASVAFVANGGPSPSVTGRLICNNAQAASVPVPSPITRLAPLPDGSAMVGTDHTSFYIFPVTVTPGQTPCPQTVTASVSSTRLYTGLFTTNQILVAPNGNQALIITDQPGIFTFNLISHTPGQIALTGNPTFVYPGGITLDSNFAYVGASDGNVHVIDLNAGTDTTTISPGITPNLVAVKPI